MSIGLWECGGPKNLIRIPAPLSITRKIFKPILASVGMCLKFSTLHHPAWVPTSCPHHHPHGYPHPLCTRFFSLDSSIIEGPKNPIPIPAPLPITREIFKPILALVGMYLKLSNPHRSRGYPLHARTTTCMGAHTHFVPASLILVLQL